MSDVFYVKANDDSPTLETTLQDSNGNSIDLTGATVQFHMMEPRGGDNVVDAQASLLDAANGTVEYDWTQSDTSQPGRYRAEFEVTYDNGNVETFPNVGYETIYIEADSG